MTKRRFQISQILGMVSEDILSLNPQLRQQPDSGGCSVMQNKKTANALQLHDGEEVREEKRRLDTLNKTERRYYDTFLAKDESEGRIVVFPQPPRFFELEGGGTYTPDFIVVPVNANSDESTIYVIEIKGGYTGPGWEQGIERYRRAAAQWHSDAIRFRKCTYDRKSGSWTTETWR